ncbi:MAG: high light inducible protein [Synechococcus sp.]
MPREQAGTATAEAPVAAEALDRQELNRWRRGFTPQAEIWNGRLAMLGLSLALLSLVLVRLLATA